MISTVLPLTIRIDRGSETGIMATMHTFLRAQYDDLDDPVDSVLYGPSTQNKIERWWRELLDRMERFFKRQLSSLVENGDYDPRDKTDRYNLMWLFHTDTLKVSSSFCSTGMYTYASRFLQSEQQKL